MAARAIYKAMLRLGDEAVPIKLYSAVQERGVHFRLLHEPDLQPIEQRMVHPDTETAVPREEVRRGFEQDGRIVVLRDEELAELQPDKSRDVEVLRVVPAARIDHRWYRRPYWLGPDGGADADYFALAAALAKSGREGVARWTMRNQRYQGALRVHQGHLMLIALRHAEEVVDASELRRPPGRASSAQEKALAKKLIDAMTGEFDPDAYADEYRQRVLELVQAKAEGRTPKMPKAPRRPPQRSLAEALQASVAAAKERSVA